MGDRAGKANVTILAMLASGSAALLTALTFGGPAWLTFALVIVWGLAVIPDSAQFSAIVADAAPPHLAGSLLTFQTALGFALTIVTVQATPLAAAALGWPLGVSFQQVVHPVPSEEAGVAKLQQGLGGGPDERAQECPSDAA